MAAPISSSDSVRSSRSTPSNVGKLGLSWSFEFDSNRGQEATPIVTGGVMYVSTAWSRVYALDAATGRQLWRYDPKIAGPDRLRCVLRCGDSRRGRARMGAYFSARSTGA